MDDEYDARMPLKLELHKAPKMITRGEAGTKGKPADEADEQGCLEGQWASKREPARTVKIC